MQPAYEVARRSADGFDVEEFRLVNATWHPVKPTGRMVPLPTLDSAPLIGAENSSKGGTNRCEAGQPCPRDGFWFTPAKADSRRQFKQGETMPSLGSDFGLTIWQLDERQG
jgi:hypothetical protein